MLLNRWKIRTQIVVGFTLGITAFTMIGIITYKGTQQLSVTAQQEKHTYQVLGELEEILSLIKDAETGQRGYLLTGDNRYLEPYNQARTLLQKRMDEFRGLVADNPSQLVYVQTLEPVVAQKLAELDSTIRLRQTQGLDAALKVVQTDEGKRLMDQVRSLISRMKAEERDLLQVRSPAAELSLSRIMASWMYGIPLGIIFLIVIGAVLNRQIQLIESLNALIAQAQKSGIQIGTSTTQIAAAGKELEATVNEQVASINEVNATCRQIASTAGVLVREMDDVASTAQTTTNAAANSQNNLDKIQGAMQNLVLATRSISAKLKVMDDKANNINNVVTTITKVADQTNLLSLNAAIEAEKAGEYGAGFAVVAREIRRLADQSAVATLEIERMIKAVQSSVSTGVMEVDKFSKEVGQCVEEVGNISGQIGGFIKDVQSLAPKFGVVSQSMDEQYRGAEQISSAIAQLSEASSQTVQSLQEINNALSQLDDATQGLQREISQFKV